MGLHNVYLEEGDTNLSKLDLTNQKMLLTTRSSNKLIQHNYMQWSHGKGVGRGGGTAYKTVDCPGFSIFSFQNIHYFCL